MNRLLLALHRSIDGSAADSNLPTEAVFGRFFPVRVEFDRN
jgi:hypothetical protein